MKKKLLAVVVVALCAMTALGIAPAFAQANTVNVSTTTELQTAMDNAQEGDVIVLAAGDYETVVLRNQTADANRILKDVTIKAATGATVNIEQIASDVSSTKFLDIENLTIDGLTFANPAKTGVWFDYNTTSGKGQLRVNGLTIQNCTKVGDNSTHQSGQNPYENHTFVGFYYDASDLPTLYAGDSSLACGYHGITIKNNTITNVYWPITFPNNGQLSNLTVTGNTFDGCTNNHIQVSGSSTSGTITLSNNTIKNMSGRFGRIAGATSTAAFVVSGNTIVTPKIYDIGDSGNGSDGDSTILKITGADGFTVSDTNNDWTAGSFTSTGTWKAFGAAAKIGTTEYKTFEDAVAGAQSGDTIELLMDVNLTNYAADADHVINLAGITLDMKGHTITSNNFGVVYDGAGLVIKNGKFVAANGGSYALFVGDEAGANNAIIDNVTCTGGINVYNSSNVTIKATTATEVTGTKYYAVWAESSSVVIEGGTFASPNTAVGAPTILAAHTDSSISVKGGVFAQDPTDFVATGYMVQANTPATGKWTVVKSYTITFDANGGDSVGMTSTTYGAGSLCGQLPSATRAGYMYAGWNTKPDGTGVMITEGSDLMSLEDFTLYAVWFKPAGSDTQGNKSYQVAEKTDAQIVPAKENAATEIANAKSLAADIQSGNASEAIGADAAAAIKAATADTSKNYSYAMSTVATVVSENVNSADVDKIEKEADSVQLHVAGVFDLSVYLSVINTTDQMVVAEGVYVKKVDNKLVFTLSVDTPLAGKEVKVVQVHDGEVRDVPVVSVDTVNNTVTIEADEFSTFGVLTSDPLPDTGDHNIWLFVGIGVVIVAAIVLLIVARRRME